MKRRCVRMLTIFAALIGIVAGSVLAGNTYMEDFPNVTVVEPDCHTFVIDVSQASGSSAILTLRVHDVDEEEGELDRVRLNGTVLGYLTGTNNTWSTTTFDISSEIIYGGDNTVEICIDPSQNEPTTWQAEIDWGQILVDGGSADDADIVSVNVSGTWDDIDVSVVVHATNEDDYRLEINLLDSVGNNKDIATQTFHLTSEQTSTRNLVVALPSEPTATETFTIEANLFNDTTGVQQQLKTTTWTYASNRPPAASNRSVSTDEDVPLVFTPSDFGYSDLDGDPMDHVKITSLESVGDLQLSGAHVALGQEIPASLIDTGNLTYTSLPDANGSPYDSFRFAVHDGTELSASDYQMTVNVVAVNDPPVSRDDAFAVDENDVGEIDVLANDSDVDGDSLTVLSVTDPEHGTAQIVASIVRYTPDAFYVGEDSFSYSAADPSGEEDSAVVMAEVIHPNLPPTANAGGLYEGDTKTPVTLDGRFSVDPDVSDLLEYRWDVEGDGTWDTDWLRSTSHTHLYERPFLGRAVLEVRDIYRGSPLGTSDQDDAYVRVLPAPTELAVSIFVDLDGNGEFDAEDVGLGGVEVVVDARTVLVTEDDGTALVRGIEPGEHTVELTEGGRTYLQDRGFFISPDASQSFSIASGEWLALLFHPEVRGFLELEMQGERESP